MRSKFCLRFLKSQSYPICQFFISKERVDKSGFVDKSGVEKSEDALYLILIDKNVQLFDVNFVKQICKDNIVIPTTFYITEPMYEKRRIKNVLNNIF